MTVPLQPPPRLYGDSRDWRELEQYLIRIQKIFAGGVIDHGELSGLADDDHSQYVHISVARTIDALLTFSRGTNPPFAVAPGAAKVDNLDVAKLDGKDWDSALTLTGTVRHTGSQFAVLGAALASQQAASANLTDNSGGTANDTIQALPDPADAPATADALRDDLVANLIPALRNDIADLTAKVNTCLTVLRTFGFIGA